MRSARGVFTRHADNAAVTTSAPPPTVRPANVRKVSRRWRQYRRASLIHLIQLLIVAVLLALWQHAGGSALGKLLYSTPADVLRVLRGWVTDGTIWPDLWVTLREAMLGYVLGAVLAIALALTLLSSTLLQRFVTPFAAAMGALPKVAMAPLFAVWFGLGTSSKVAFVLSITFFLIFWGASTGLRTIDVIYLHNARLQGAKRLWLLREVYLPATVGWVMTSLRLCVSWALIGATIAEYLGSSEGIGYVVRTAQSTYDQAVVISGILVISIVALIFDRIFWQVERRFSRWRVS